MRKGMAMLASIFLIFIIFSVNLAVSADMITLNAPETTSANDSTTQIETTTEIETTETQTDTAQTAENKTEEYKGEKVLVGVYVLNLGKFDIATGSFTADFYLSIKCNESCPGGMDFEFMNGRASSLEKVIDENDEKFYRIQANLNSPINLREFPFDKQELQIVLEDKELTVDDLVYAPNDNESGIDPNIVFSGWDLGEGKGVASAHEYKIYNETYSQYVFKIPISKIVFNSFLKSFLPIIFIILVMLSSFVLDPDKITTRIAMVGSALVATVMFHVSLANQIPAVGYMTFADKFMILTYFVLVMSFVFNVFLLELHERKQEKLVEKYHRMTEFAMFVVVPILYLLLFLWEFMI